MTTVADEVRERRTRLGLSQLALATRAGVYRDSISNMEVGKSKNPHQNTLDAVRKALDEVEAERGLPPFVAPLEAAPRTAVANGVLRVTIEGINGGDRSISVEAPVGNLPELSRLVDRILDHLAAQERGA